MSLILAIPILEFNIGNYQFNAYTYPAWSSLILQIISVILNIVFLDKIENHATEQPNITTKEKKDNIRTPPTKKKNIYISTGVILILSIFFFDGYYLSVMAYALPVVMLESYGW